MAQLFSVLITEWSRADDGGMNQHTPNEPIEPNDLMMDSLPGSLPCFPDSRALQRKTTRIYIGAAASLILVIAVSLGRITGFSLLGGDERLLTDISSLVQYPEEDWSKVRFTGVVSFIEPGYYGIGSGETYQVAFSDQDETIDMLWDAGNPSFIPEVGDVVEVNAVYRHYMMESKEFIATKVALVEYSEYE